MSNKTCIIDFLVYILFNNIKKPAYAHEYPLFVIETKKDIVSNESQVHMHVKKYENKYK